MALVANNLYEVVSRREIEDQETFLRDALIGVDNIYIRLKAQDAPALLIEHVFDLRYKLTECMNQIREVRNCFPETQP